MKAMYMTSKTGKTNRGFSAVLYIFAYTHVHVYICKWSNWIRFRVFYVSFYRHFLKITIPRAHMPFICGRSSISRND